MSDQTHSNKQGLTWYIPRSKPPISTIFLPFLKDNSTDNHHGNVEGIEDDKPHRVEDVDVASPEEIECPVSSEQVKDDVSQERTLSQRKWLGDGHRADDYCGHKYPSTWRKR